MVLERWVKSLLDDEGNELNLYILAIDGKRLRKLSNRGLQGQAGWGTFTLQWRHNGPHGVSNHQLHHCLLNPLFRRRSKKTSKPRVTGLCPGNSPVTGEFPARMASNAEKFSIKFWWRHHEDTFDQECYYHYHHEITPHVVPCILLSHWRWPNKKERFETIFFNLFVMITIYFSWRYDIQYYSGFFGLLSTVKVNI